MHNPNDKTDYLVILANTLDESDEIRDEAISELKALGISDNEIKERYKSLESELVQLKAFEKYNAILHEENATERYTPVEMIKIFLFGPYETFKFFDSGLVDLYKDNFKIKFRQRLILITGGTLFYILLMILIFKYQVMKD